ncbi:MAG: aminopeptidase P family protein [Deltaproteobacteria bacterium]|nr:aminopeptidase P family protein [Deltaproteobacteria bacterium]
MNRILTLALVLLSSVALAQPGGDGGKPTPKGPPIASDPVNPYAQAPTDPYADPPAPPPKPKPKKATPDDPYAEVPAVEAPLPPAPPPPKGKATKPGKANPKAKPPKVDPFGPPGPDPASAPAVMPGKGSRLTDPYAEPAPLPASIPARVGISDLTAVQGLLAVQRLDGWLLFDRDGENPIASRLVAPEGHPTRPWFYFLPAKGPPLALVHSSEQRSFDHLPGKKLTYVGYRDLDKQLKVLLKGARSVALEYSPKAAVPSISRVDAGTVERIRAAGVQVRSSETLVQFTKAIWGDAGRTAHFVAVHHLMELRKDALAFAAKSLQTGQAITEYDLQQRLVRGMTMRGLASTPPVVAAGANTADPYYVPNAAKAAPIRRGDVIVISLAAKVDKPEGIWAAHTWVAVADNAAAEPVRKAFEAASLARDQALALITDRSRKHRPITGAGVDDATRAFIKKAGYADNVMHRTGHSLDNDLQGGGADLDNYEVRDTRILTPGTGFTVGPGLYFAGQFGVRTEVSVYLSPNGPEVTTPAQDDIELLLKR